MTADSKPGHRRVRSIVHRRTDGDGTLELDRSALKDAALVVVPGGPDLRARQSYVDYLGAVGRALERAEQR